MFFLKEDCVVNAGLKVECTNNFRVFKEKQEYFLFIIQEAFWILDEDFDLIKVFHMDFHENFKIK